MELVIFLPFFVWKINALILFFKMFINKIYFILLRNRYKNHKINQYFVPPTDLKNLDC
jgi:hypothetical protein